MSTYLTPLQLGYGVPGGVEAIAHTMRHYLHNCHEGRSVLKLDFCNAFNTVRRDKILETVRNVVPVLYPFVYSAYRSPSSLFCGSSIIPSQEQGDPLGPLLFCLTIHPMLQQLRSELKVFYLDDGTLGGCHSEIIQDLHLIEEMGADLDLQLNHSKSEVIHTIEDSDSRNLIPEEMPNLCTTDISNATILGSPIGTNEQIDETIQDKITQAHGGKIEKAPDARCPLTFETFLCHPQDPVYIAHSPLFPLCTTGSV